MSTNTNKKNITMTVDTLIPFDSLTVDYRDIPKKTKTLDIQNKIISGVKCQCVQFDYWNCGVTLDIFKHICSNFAKKVIEIFGEEEVEKALANITMDKIVRQEKVSLSNLKFYIETPYDFVVGDVGNIKIQVNKGEWTKEETVKGVTVLVHSSYNSVYEVPIIKALLYSKWPWLENFECAIYGWNLNEYEFYVHFKEGEEKKTLYVPLKALINGDASIIRDRMHSYFKQYYIGRPEAYEKAMSVLNMKECIDFMVCVMGNKEAINSLPIIEENKQVEIKWRGEKYTYLLLVVENNEVHTHNYSTFNEGLPDFKVEADYYLNKYGELTFGQNLNNGHIYLTKDGVFQLHLMRIQVEDK